MASPDLRSPGAPPISTAAQLRALIPEPSSKVRLKILDRLERHSQHIIGTSSLIALSCRHTTGWAPMSLITTPERVRARGDQQLEIEDGDGALARAWDLSSPRPVGALFMVAGIGETLRVNGRAARGHDGRTIVVEVEATFLQCPKAFVRSRLWDPATWARSPAASADEDAAPASTLTPSMRAFVERSPFALVASSGADGRADVSPRGDPAGQFIRCLDDRTLLLPDRTGNHLVDTLLNVLDEPRVSLALLAPGEADTLHLRAEAQLTADKELLAASAVNGRAPKVGIVLAVEAAWFARAELPLLWDRARLVDPADFPTMGEMILDQVNPGGKALNKIGSAIFDLANSYHKKRRLY